MIRFGPWSLSTAAVALLLGLLACQREDRRFHEAPPYGKPVDSVQMSDLHPAQESIRKPISNPYEGNAWAVSEGERLYNSYNCVGCHAHGGGGIGPPLMDAPWIYGSEPENIYSTIVEGRPNGMPSFRGKIPEQQVWQIVAYVRSLSGQLPKDVAPGRSDHMNMKKPPQSHPKENPQNEQRVRSGQEQTK